MSRLINVDAARAAFEDATALRKVGPNWWISNDGNVMVRQESIIKHGWKVNQHRASWHDGHGWRILPDRFYTIGDAEEAASAAWNERWG